MFSLVCANGDIRLSGGANDNEGLVEICYNATWGTVCDNMWGPINANVACRQLGFPSTGMSHDTQEILVTDTRCLVGNVNFPQEQLDFPSMDRQMGPFGWTM